MRNDYLDADEKPLRAEILKEAEKVICHDRQDQYGEPENVFGDIAMYWSTYLSTSVSPKDVAMMMALFKIAREKVNHKRDNLVDLCGYVSIAGELEGIK